MRKETEIQRGCSAYHAHKGEAEDHETVRDALLRTWFTMLKLETDRRRVRDEKKLNDELGFDVVDIGGEG